MVRVVEESCVQPGGRSTEYTVYGTGCDIMTRRCCENYLLRGW
jgi:hypothetical protein